MQVTVWISQLRKWSINCQSVQTGIPMSHSVPTALGPPLLASEAVWTSCCSSLSTVRLRFGHHFYGVRLVLSSGSYVLCTYQGAGKTRPRSALTGSMLPTTLREMSLCDVEAVKQSAEMRSALDPPMFFPERHEVLR